MTNTEDHDSTANESEPSSAPATATATSPEPDLATRIAEAIRAKDGGPKSKPEPAISTDPPAEVEEADDDERTGPDWDLEDDETNKAWNVLRRDDWPPEFIRQLSRADLLARAAKRSKVQADIDRAFSSTKSGKEAPAETGENGHQAAPATTPDVSTLSETLGWDEAESQALAKYVEASIQAAVMPTLKLVLARLEQDESKTWTAARDELKGRIPQLADDETFQRLHEKAQSIKAATKAKALEAAAVADGLEVVPTSEIERKQRLAKLRKSGTPSAPSGQPKRPQLSGASKIAEGIRLAEQGLTREEILARLG